MAKLNESPSGSSEVRSRSDRGAIVPASQVRAEQGSSTVLISSSSPETRAMTQRPRALSPVQSPAETLSNFLQGVGAPTNEMSNQYPSGAVPDASQPQTHQTFVQNTHQTRNGSSWFSTGE